MRTKKSNRVQSPTKSKTTDDLNRLAIAGFLFLLFASLFLRIWHLDFIPGLNGDETWLAVQIRDFLSGVEYSFKTPSQRTSSPLHWVLVAIAQFVPLTNIWILRLPTMLASLVTPLATYWLFRKSLSRRELWTLTLLAAALPVHLAFARSMGEMSQVPLVGAFIFGYLWQKRWLAAVLAYLVGLTIYPTNIFLGPIVLAMLIYQNHKRINWKALLSLLPVVGLFALTAIYFCLPPNGFEELGNTILLNLLNPSQIFGFAEGYFRLFSGVISYLDFSGPLSDSQLFAFDSLSWLVLGGPLLVGAAISIRRSHFRNLTFWGGYLLMLILIYLFAQRNPFDVGYERYALFLVFPTSLLWTLSLEEIGTQFPRFKKVSPWLVILLIAGLLFSFHAFYMQKFIHSGGEGHNTYRTSQPEPKLQVFEWIQKDYLKGKSINSIVVEDWWLYWTMRYFNSEERDFKIYGVDAKIFEFAPSRFYVNELEWISMLKSGGYLVGFWGDPLFQKIESLRQSQQLESIERVEIKDQLSRPIIAIWHLRSL